MELEEGDAMLVESEDLLALDDAPSTLEQWDPQSAQVVKLRYFAGLTMPQVAGALEISLRTAERNGTYARTWLHAALAQDGARSAVSADDHTTLSVAGESTVPRTPVGSASTNSGCL